MPAANLMSLTFNKVAPMMTHLNTHLNGPVLLSVNYYQLWNAKRAMVNDDRLRILSATLC